MAERKKVERDRECSSHGCAAVIREKNVLRRGANQHTYYIEIMSSLSMKCSYASVTGEGRGTEAAHKEQDPGKLVMVQNLEVGRKPQIDASILKILKANGIMDCNDLVREVTKQLQDTKDGKSASILSLRGKNDIVEFYGD
ncbi:cullin-3A-like protein [Tanacetum coccineum]